MAELGIAAGVAGVVGFGAKLSVALYDFATTMAVARREIFSVAQEVAQSSAALKQVSKTISNPRTARHSTSAIGAILDITISCQDRFTELNSIVDRLQAEKPKNGEVSVSFVAKVKWVFGRRSKVHDLREELNATKLTLLLMMSTLNLSNEQLSRRNSTVNLIDLNTGPDVEEEQQIVDSLKIAQQMSIENLRERENERGIEQHPCVEAEDVARVSVPVDAQDLASTMPRSTLQKRLSSLLEETASEFTSIQTVPNQTTSFPSQTEQALLTRNAPVSRYKNKRAMTGKGALEAVLDSPTKPTNMTVTAAPNEATVSSQPRSTEKSETQDLLLSTSTVTQSLGVSRHAIVSPVEIMKRRKERERIRAEAANEQRQLLDVVMIATKAADAEEVPSQSVSRSRTAFPHAFERWEDLSAKWEGLTGYWLQRIEQATEEACEQPLNTRLSRQVTDLSAAGNNLFHALVELQRLRASSERKFQRWFFETRKNEERAQEASAQLEQALVNERRARADDLKTWDAREEKTAKQLRLYKQENVRTWAEIGRSAQQERDRIAALKEGETFFIGGYLVAAVDRRLC